MLDLSKSHTPTQFKNSLHLNIPKVPQSKLACKIILLDHTRLMSVNIRLLLQYLHTAGYTASYMY